MPSIVPCDGTEEARMFRKIRRSILLGAAVLSASLTWAQEKAISLRIGDPAPSLTAAQWLKGAPIKQFENGKIYLLDFWATW